MVQEIHSSLVSAECSAERAKIVRPVDRRSILGPYRVRGGTSLRENVFAKFNLFASKDRREGPSPGSVHRRSASDLELVRALRAGEAEGTALFFDRYRRHVLRVLVHALGPDRELMDLVQ